MRILCEAHLSNSLLAACRMRGGALLCHLSESLLCLPPNLRFEDILLFYFSLFFLFLLLLPPPLYSIITILFPSSVWIGKEPCF